MEHLPRPGLSMHVVHIEGQAVVNLVGELDITTGPRLLALERTAAASHPPLVLDLAGLRFLDAAGLRPIVRLAATIGVRLRNPRPIVRRVLSITGFDRYVDEVSRPDCPSAGHLTTLDALSA